jgi:hypothetical protein
VTLLVGRLTQRLDDLLAVFLTVFGDLDAPGGHRVRSCVHRQRASSESLPRAHAGLKLWGFCELILHGRVSPTDRKNPLRGPSNSRSSTPATNVTSIRAEKGLTMKNVGAATGLAHRAFDLWLLSTEHGFDAKEQLSKDDHKHNHGASGDQYYCDPVCNRLERLKHLPNRHGMGASPIRWDDLWSRGASRLSLQGPQGGHGRGTLSINRPVILHGFLTRALLMR